MSFDHDLAAFQKWLTRQVREAEKHQGHVSDEYQQGWLDAMNDVLAVLVEEFGA